MFFLTQEEQQCRKLSITNLSSWLQIVVKEKSISIKRLARMFFGKTTENLKNLKARAAKQTASDNDGSEENASRNGSEQASDKQVGTDQKNELASSSNNASSEDKFQNNEKSDENLSCNESEETSDKQADVHEENESVNSSDTSHTIWIM